MLDGFPKSLLEARNLFTDPRDWTQQELDSQASALTTNKVKDAKKAAPGKDVKGKAAPIDDVPEPRRLRNDLLPSALVRSTPYTIRPLNIQLNVLQSHTALPYDV